MKNTIGLMFFAAYNLGFSISFITTWVYQGFIPRVIIYMWFITLILSCGIILISIFGNQIKKNWKAWKYLDKINW